MGRRNVPARVVRIAQVGVAVACALTLANCGRSNVDPKYGVAASRRVVDPGEPVPKGGGTYRVGKPYQVAGRTYVPEENTNYEAEGVASWYGDVFHGRLTANGEVFDMNSISAAHPTLPIPSYVRVTNLRNKRSLIVRVNDRGPFHENRVIDVSVRAAKLLDFHQYGLTRVRVEYVGRASLGGSDDERLAATLRTGEPAQVMMASAKPAAKPQRSYQPEYFDPRPTVRAQNSSPPIHHVSKRTPTPAPSPETVARAPVGQAYGVAPDRSSAASPPRVATANGAASFESRFVTSAGGQGGPAQVRTEPASAFAPRFDGVMTGRGIY